MIVLSDEMFERVVARARAIGEEHFRRFVFNNDGMNPEAIELVREPIIDMITKCTVENWARAAHELPRESAWEIQHRAAAASAA